MNETFVILPVILPLFGAASGLLLYNHYRWQRTWSFVVMLLSFGASLAQLNAVWRGGAPLVYQVGNWPAPFGISLVADLLSSVMLVMAQAVLSAGMLYALGSKDQCVSYPAFFPLFLTLAGGLSGAFMTGDLFNLFVFAELMVISGTLLTAISDDKAGTEAAFKYFYISLFASVFLLLAAGVFYISYGTLNLADLARSIAAAPDQPLLSVGIVFLMAFFLVKSAVVPFHFWQPDFHTTAPTPVSAMLSSVVVKVGVYGLLRMITLLFPAQAETLRPWLVALGILGVVFGGLGAIGTHNVKRMLAYSTLGQMGFILVAIGWGTPLALAAAIVFAFNHGLIKAAMLMLAGTVASRSPVKSAAFTAIAGLGRQMPLGGVLFLLGGMALAGIPPTNGFVSKLILFTSGIEAERYLPLLLLGLASLLTLIYVGRAFQKIWWEMAGESLPAKPAGDRLLAPALLIGLCLLLGLQGDALLQLAMAVASWLNSPASYIQAVLTTTGL